MRSFTFLFLFISFTCNISFSQFVDCDPISSSGCNRILNHTFTPSSNYNPNDPSPFAQSFILPWQASHGTPQLNVNSTPPFSGANFAFMFAANGINAQEPNGGEGIFQKIPALQTGNKYALSFFRQLTVAISGVPAMDQFNIVLMKCDDAGIFDNSTHFIPPIPQKAQVIYCEQNIFNTNWEQIFTCFVAEDDYDIIWIFPKKTSVISGYSNVAAINFAYPELIDITNFDAGSNPNPVFPNCNITIGPVAANCSVKNAVFTWHGPNGTVVTAPSNQQITVNASTQSGKWELRMTVPGANTTNNSCGSICTIIDEVNVPPCSSTTPTISPSGPITLYTQYEIPTEIILTSSNATGNQWYKNGVMIPGATNSTFAIHEDVSNGYLTSYSETYSVSVNGSFSNTVTFNYIPCYGNATIDCFPVANQSVFCSPNFSGISVQPNLGASTQYTWYIPISSWYTAENCIQFSGQSANTINLSVASCTNGSVVHTIAENQGSQIRMQYWVLKGNCRTFDENISVSPIPANSSIKVTSMKEFERIEVYSLLSNTIQKIYTFSKSKTQFLDISSLRPGHYYLKIVGENAITYKRILIQR